jgi:hypothetical protein
MRFYRFCLATSFAFLEAVTPALAQEAPPRVRGTIVGITSGSLTVKMAGDQRITLATGTYTTYATVVPASLEDIKPNEYIGTASKGPRGHWVAVETVIIPESMRAGRKGYASWDPLPDPTDDGSSVATSMTNGSVSRIIPTTSKLTPTNMTNGVVTTEKQASTGRTLTVVLTGGEEVHILFPATVPVVRFVPTDRSAISVGSTIFIKTSPGNKATLVAVGKGVTPPM